MPTRSPFSSMPTRSASDYLDLAIMLILDKSSYTSEREGRTRQLLKAAEVAANINQREGKRADDTAMREFRSYLLTGRMPERRDMGTGTGAYPGGTGFPVPLEFEASVFLSMRAVDNLWSPAVTSIYETAGGGPWSAPCVDDSLQEAEQVTESAPSHLQDIAIGQVSFPKAVTYRSKGIKFSQELLQDSAIDVPALLSSLFATRFQRVIGRTVLVPALIAAAPVVRTATGATAASQAPGDATDSVSSEDLTYAFGQLNEAYADESSWLMNRRTMTAQAGRRSSTGGKTPASVDYDAAGNPILLGRPIAICPSMADLGTGNTPILCGALKRLAIRIVRGGMYMNRSDQRFAEFGQVWFEAFFRANAGIAFYSSDPATPPPLVAIKNA